MAAEPINDPDTPADPRAADTQCGSLLHAAMLAVNAGYFVFPVRPVGKEPALKDWEGRATRDRVTVRRWWRRTPYNVGIAAGPSGIVVVDLDDGHGATAPEPFAGARHGREVLTRLAARAGAEVPTDTFTVRTPSGGQHLYFRARPEIELRNTAGMLGWRIDTRARGGYVVGAGSIRPEGRYRVARPGPLRELPGWLLQALTPPPPRLPMFPSRRPRGPVRAYVHAIVEAEAGLVAAAQIGTRHTTLLRAALKLGNLVGSGELDEQTAYVALAEAAAGHIGVDGCTEREVGQTITDGLAYGRGRPRSLRPRPRSLRPNP